VSEDSLRHRLEYWALRLTRAQWAFLPERLTIGLGGLTGLIGGSVLRIRRYEVDEHLALAFPGRTHRWRRDVARRSYRHLGREAALFLRMGGWSRKQILDRVRFVGFDCVREAADQERGVILLTGHLGNWEMAGAGGAALGFELDAVGKGMANRRVEADLFAMREHLGIRVIEMSDAPREVLRSIGRGRIAALLGDQDAHQHGVFVPFFGRPAATARGPALFALRTGAPIFVGFAVRDPGREQRYTFVARRLEYDVSGDLDRDVVALLAAYHRALEEAIRDAPEQYLWQHRRWKTRPSEEQPASR
jgi:KDO2-lipid IV(A) lauroyltransferase